MNGNTLPAILLPVVALSLGAGEIVESDLSSDLIPRPVPYAALVPDGHSKDAEWPVLFLLHGGGGDRRFLRLMQPWIEELWKTGRLSKMIVVTPSAATRGFYMDFKDGSEKWESFIIGPFREHLEKTYGASRDSKKRLIGGISMGGMGSLRIAFKHPHLFAGIAAMEPGIEPVLKWSEIQPRHRFWRETPLFEAAFGKPVDAVYWEQNNPASIAKASAEKLRQSGLQIYIECGDEDMFLLHEGTEFLHRVLWDSGVKHEYHLVRGADHLGRTIRARFQESLLFLERALNPPGPDPAVQPARKRLEPLKKKSGVKQ
jgi:S-formylglutathione hydrolase